MMKIKMVVVVSEEKNQYIDKSSPLINHQIYVTLLIGSLNTPFEKTSKRIRQDST